MADLNLLEFAINLDAKLARDLQPILSISSGSAEALLVYLLPHCSQ